MIRSQPLWGPVLAGILLDSLLLNGVAATGQETGKKSDAKSHWTVVASGVKDDLHCVRFVTPELGWAVGDCSTILHSRDGGKTWVRQIPRDADGWRFQNIVFASPKVGYTRTDILNKILRTTDGGATWEDVPLPEKGYGKGAFFTQDAAVGSSYFLRRGGLVFRTTDGGNSWTQSELPDAIGNGGWGRLSFADDDHGCLALGDNSDGGKVAITSDGGKTWKGQEKISIRPSNQVQTQLIDAKVGFIVPQYGNVHRTIDGGKTWQALKLETQPGLDLHFVSTQLGHVLHRSERSNLVSRTTDGGASWQALQVVPVAPRYVYSLSFPDVNHGVVVGSEGFIARYQSESSR